MEQVIIGLNDFGFTSNMAAKIYQKYKTDALDVIKENPYQLIADIDGIGFKRADAIAANLHIAPDSQIRLGGAVLSELQRLTDGEGDTYVMLPQLVSSAVGGAGKRPQRRGRSQPRGPGDFDADEKG